MVNWSMICFQNSDSSLDFKLVNIGLMEWKAIFLQNISLKYKLHLTP